MLAGCSWRFLALSTRQIPDFYIFSYSRYIKNREMACILSGTPVFLMSSPLGVNVILLLFLGALPVASTVGVAKPVLGRQAARALALPGQL